MAKNAFDKFYKKVPQEQKEQLIRFRSAHQSKHLDVAGTEWEYISGGQGEETLLLLPGAFGNPEISFKIIMALENDYRVIAPTYPSTATTMAQLMDGAAAILEAEGISHAHVLGGSFGGIVAQCFVRKYPQMVDKLILSHTIPPKAERVKRSKRVAILLFFFPLWLILSLTKKRTSKMIPEEHAEYEFWQAYLKEEITHLNKKVMQNILKRGIDLDQNYTFTPDDLKDWPGKMLILESGDDPLAPGESREVLKSLYPRAQVNTFHGTGHASSIIKPEEYLSAVKKFLKED